MGLFSGNGDSYKGGNNSRPVDKKNDRKLNIFSDDTDKTVPFQVNSGWSDKNSKN